MNALRPLLLSALFALVAFSWLGCAGSQPAAVSTPDASQAQDSPQAVPAQAVRVDTVVVTRPAAPYDVDLDTVRAGRFDYGKMWTFDAPPVAYFAEAYEFEPDSAWFAEARLGALRIPGCSASFVSPHGLVMTNHHCAREHVVAVSGEGENLLDNGFYAASLADERRVEDLYADQLVAIVDVTVEIETALLPVDAEDRAEAREAATEGVRERMIEELGGEEAGFEVEVIALYNGGRYSAYTFRRYDDVRLVMAPELSVGYFGGDPDNFTYPRYNLDVSFFRIYVDDAPYETPHFFRWSTDGTVEGEPVFVVGNPGSTSRLQTVAELEFRRDVEEPLFNNLIKSRLEILRAFREQDPEAAEEIDLINTIFGLENELKRQGGVLDGLHDAVLMRRREDAEARFRAALAADPDLESEYGTLIDEFATLQDEAREQRLVEQLMAFLVNPEIEWISSTLNRAVYGFLYSFQRMQGVPASDLEDLRESLLEVSDQPEALERMLLARRFEDVRRLMGPDHPVAQTLLSGSTPEEAAARILSQTAVKDSARFAEMLDGFAESDDPAVALGRMMAIGLIEYQQGAIPIEERQEEIASALGRARYRIYGTELPPDATFSLRIADGVVSGYAYNGTLAPAYSSFYGLYDRYYMHGGEPWDLPERWLNPPPEFDLATPLNLVSTNDTVGGNSGSPLINRALEVVGLLFDGNIEGLSGDFIYTEEGARAVAVDVRGILEALDDIYGADRLVLELARNRFVESEAEADEMMPR